MATNNSLSASIQPKSGRLYAVIHVKENGKSKAVWRTLGLPDTVGKAKANKALREVVNEFEKAYLKKLARNGRPEADIPIYDYLSNYLKKVTPTLQHNSVVSYSTLIEGRIKQYFTKHSELTVENLTPKDIQKFYDYLTALGVGSNTVIHYHAMLRRAFRQAFKDEMIDANPFDRIDRPKKEKYHGAHYSEEELETLLNIMRSDIIYPAIMLAGGLGLRRSEALGVRWSRIDWDKKCVLLDTKIVEYNIKGKKVPKPEEKMKNESSRRTLPLPEMVLDMLTEQKEKQDEYRKMFKKSYNREYDDYVCVDRLGNLLKPSYITSHFNESLKKYGLRHIRFHDLRHTYASILVSKEVPLLNVSELLGHSDISTTANIYAHLDKSGKQVGADIMNDIFKDYK